VSDFEFMGRVTIGQYLPVDSFLHRLDGRARVLMFTGLVMALTFARNPLGLLVGLVGVGLGLLMGSIPIRFAFKGLLPPLPFLLILAVLQLFFNASKPGSPEVFHIGGVIITFAGVVAGGMLLLRFLVLILAISLATFCLSTSQMIHALDSLFSPLRRIGISTRDGVMVLQITLRFLPLLAQVAERIAKAQASRGAQWAQGKGSIIKRARQVIPLIVPLFIAALHKAENMAFAMDARAYGSHPYPTSMAEMHFKLRDALALVAAVGLCVLVIAL
jgi:energy-coupling factor transport system permease protein